jgi:hypothetical protein
MDNSQGRDVYGPQLEMERVVFRTTWIGRLFPVVVACAIGWGAFFLKNELKVPIVGWGVLVCMSCLWLFHAISMWFFLVEFDCEQVVIRWYGSKSIPWSSIRRWSDYTEKSTLYFRTNDGKVLELLSLCVFGSRRKVASSYFYRYVGEASIGKESVAPDWIKSLEQMFGNP